MNAVETINADLLQSCKELREVNRALLIVIGAHGLMKQFELSLSISGIPDGFGVRAQAAIERAESA